MVAERRPLSDAAQLRQAESAARLAELILQFHKQINETVTIEVSSSNRLRLLLPSIFLESKPLTLELKRGEHGWILSDHRQLQNWYSRSNGTSVLQRQPPVLAAMEQYKIQGDGSEFYVPLDKTDLANSLLRLLQFLSHLVEVKQDVLIPKCAHFVEQFQSMLIRHVSKKRLAFQWVDSSADPYRLHRVDCRIDAQPVWLAFAVRIQSECSRVVRTCEFWRANGLEFRAVVFYENLRYIPSSALAPVSNLVDKQFSSLDCEETIASFLKTRVLRRGRH